MIKKYFCDRINRNFSIAIIWINGGSSLDSFGKKGINHILCSLLTRGCEGFDNLALSDYIESYGAELNHEVFEDGFLISLKSLDSYFKKIYPLIDLIINKPILSKTQFQKVKKSTINAIKKDKENPFNNAFEKWRKIVYLNHPYAYNSNGYEEDVLELNYNDVLFEFEKFRGREKFLITNNPLVKPESIKNLDRKINQINHKQLNSEFSKNVRFVSSNNNSNQTIFMLGNQTCSRNSSDYLPLKILESHLSYGMSSKLFKIFREKNGITYDVGVYNPVRKENSPFLIYLSVSNTNSSLAFDLLMKLWKELLSKQISEIDIFLAKEKLKGSFLINNQSLDEILQRDVQLISYGLNPLVEKNCSKDIEAVSSFDIQRIMKKYFSKPYLSFNGDQKISKIIEEKWIYMFGN